MSTFSPKQPYVDQSAYSADLIGYGSVWGKGKHWSLFFTLGLLHPIGVEPAGGKKYRYTWMCGG
ncbi:hypothetical protein [Metabacillus indicus]|uniref:hypothetical protein n=1 Tax=Metabacillus indicus TaxID=246786 RepID=UPI000555F222|nr:hypothetical protein [Metabacillus indicus]